MAPNEFALIRQLFHSARWRELNSTHPSCLLGPGDDCALVTPPPNEHIALSIDTALPGVHFPQGATGAQIAVRACSTALSDLAACGANPLGFLVAVQIPQLDEDFLHALSDGLYEVASHYSIPLLGGNMARGLLAVTVQVVGSTSAALRRDQAQEGDRIFVSGTLATAAAGLVKVRDDLHTEHPFAAAYWRPTPRIQLGMCLRGIASSAIDISDGLVQDVGHIAQASGLGAQLDRSALPVHPDVVAEYGSEQALLWAANAGDDYELCFTVPVDKIPLLHRNAPTFPPCVEIGHMVSGTGVYYMGEDSDIPASGYDHFASN